MKDRYVFSKVACRLEKKFHRKNSARFSESVRLLLQNYEKSFHEKIKILLLFFCKNEIVWRPVRSSHLHGVHQQHRVISSTGSIKVGILKKWGC